MAENKRDQQIAAAESAALNPQPAPAAAPPKPVTQGNGVTAAAAEAKYKELTAPTPAPKLAPSLMERVKGLVGLKAGGPVKGPGTSTSDSIPARLSKGEYVLPADTVKKVGVKNLEHLRASTHNPDNRVPARAKHKPGSRGGAMAGMKCGGKVK